jgi:nucleoside-diphosphate-sugar epimerase
VAAVVDALDGQAIRDAVARAGPEAVVDVLTALPPRGPVRARDFAPTNRLRRVGSRNLLEAAVGAGVRRYVAESVAFMYPPSETPIDESAPLLDPEILHSVIGDGFRAAATKERMVREATREGRIEGLVLRYGAFYGAFAGTIRYLVRMARRRGLFLPAGGPGIIPWIHVEDAAAATVAAVERGRPGEIYNVVDDGEVSFGAFTTELTGRLGLPGPRSVPPWLARPFAPYGVLLMVDARLRVSNAKAKRELAWNPAFPTHREGLAQVAAALRASAAS